jgi:hypothetical protein
LVAGLCERLIQIDHKMAAAADNTALFRQHG